MYEDGDHVATASRYSGFKMHQNEPARPERNLNNLMELASQLFRAVTQALDRVSEQKQEDRQPSQFFFNAAVEHESLSKPAVVRATFGHGTLPGAACQQASGTFTPAVGQVTLADEQIEVIIKKLGIIKFAEALDVRLRKVEAKMIDKDLESAAE